ncbi:MAG TPA: peptidylprolyl isomerase, partial [Arenimonas sp.]|uniref:peptidylprolyl isomerase n=1 Tax=Arenimonas sp. TaxID=1872635 RepID=UPI002D80E64C
MTLRPALFALALVLPLGTACATSPPQKALTMQDVLDASTPADWRTLDPAQTLYLELASGRVVIELAPQFAPAHVDNIRTLVRAGYFDGLSINRSQDNFVVQWGDANGEDPAKARPLGEAKAKLPAEFVRPAEGLAFTVLPDADGWAPEVGFVQGFPAARDPKAGIAWLAHCYGTVGAGRAMAADSSNGTELYVVTGQSPRQLDRNITTVGRVVQGIEHLSVLPRGTGPLGFYEQAGQRVPIRAIRLAADVPEAERSALQVMRTDTRAFADLVESRRNRRDDWYVH